MDFEGTPLNPVRGGALGLGKACGSHLSCDRGGGGWSLGPGLRVFSSDFIDTCEAAGWQSKRPWAERARCQAACFPRWARLPLGL